MARYDWASHAPAERLRVIGVALSFLLGAGNAARAADDLSKVRSAFDFARSAQASFELREVKTSKLQSAPVLNTEDVRCVREGDWWGIQFKRPIDNNPDRYLQTNMLFRGDDGMVFNSQQDVGGEPRSDRVSDASLYSPSIAKTRASRDRIWPTPNIELVCFGFLDGQPIGSPDGLLSDPKVIAEDGGLIKVGADSRFGKLLMWCDPDRGHLPRRIEFVQTPENHSRGRKIADIVMNAGNVWPAGRVKGIRWSIDLDLDGKDPGLTRPYVSGWRIDKQTLCEAGVTVREKIDAEVESFQTNESGKHADFLFGLKVPKRSNVRVTDAGHLSYLWDGDWAAPAASTLPRSGLAASGSVRWIFVAANAALLMVIGALILLRGAAKTYRGHR
jgi:hypothetical protein